MWCVNIYGVNGESRARNHLSGELLDGVGAGSVSSRRGYGSVGAGSK